MNKFTRSSAILASALLSFSIGAAATAHAEPGDMVRMSQSRLTDLGYYTGRSDGKLGRITRTALKSFQASNGLPVTGTLNAETFNLLIRADYGIRHGGNINQIVQVASYTRYAAPTIIHIAYYHDSNGYTRSVNSPAVAVTSPVMVMMPSAAPTFTPVSYTYSYGTPTPVYAHY